MAQQTKRSRHLNQPLKISPSIKNDFLKALLSWTQKKGKKENCKGVARWSKIINLQISSNWMKEWKAKEWEKKKNMTRTLMNPTSLPHSILMINCYQLLAHKVQHQIVRFLVSFLLISLKFHCFELFFVLIMKMKKKESLKSS